MKIDSFQFINLTEMVKLLKIYLMFTYYFLYGTKILLLKYYFIVYINLSFLIDNPLALRNR